jgi:hypothetical protein
MNPTTRTATPAGPRYGDMLLARLARSGGLADARGTYAEKHAAMLAIANALNDGRIKPAELVKNVQEVRERLRIAGQAADARAAQAARDFAAENILARAIPIGAGGPVQNGTGGPAAAAAGGVRATLVSDADAMGDAVVLPGEDPQANLLRAQKARREAITQGFTDAIRNPLFLPRTAIA